MSKSIKQGEVWWVDFEPAKGGEIKKQRPAIVVSPDYVNKNWNRCQVVPLTSSGKKIYLGELFVKVNGNRQKALINQIRTVSKLRIDNKQGELSVEDFERLRQKMKVYFELQDGKKIKPSHVHFILSLKSHPRKHKPKARPSKRNGLFFYFTQS
jgi:mRNA interferase MazF